MSFLHFKLKFCIRCQVRFQHHSFPCGYPTVSAPVVGDSSSLIKWSCILVGNQLAICVGLLIIFYCIPLICMSVLCQYHTVSITVALYCFKIMKYESSNFLFQYLNIQGTFHFHTNFRITLSISAKKSVEILIRIVLNL